MNVLVLAGNVSSPKWPPTSSIVREVKHVDYQPLESALASPETLGCPARKDPPVNRAGTLQPSFFQRAMARPGSPGAEKANVIAVKYS
jgi:hypothetical protein